MNPQTKKEAESIVSILSKNEKNFKGVNVVICPPFPFIFMRNIFKNKKIKFGSQDIYFEKEGSFTGEVSVSMIKDFKLEYVILGHSERRAMGENNELINKKVDIVLKSKIIPILCVGEKERDQNGFYLSFIKQQIEESLKNISKNQIENIIFAYEPVWAIGKNATRVATPNEFNEIKIYIKKIISDLYDVKVASSVKIIYGGSVNEQNAKLFLDEGADGLLVGRDSLNPKKFMSIINLATQ